MSKNEEDSINQSSPQKGPGCRLQAARIEQGITIDEIARQMNLNTKILELLEEDDYDDLQSPIFIRGYLRTYSRLVGENGDEIVRIFGEVYQKEDPEIKSIRSTTPEISSNDARVKWMTYLVVLGLLALITLWWFNQKQPMMPDLNSVTSVDEMDLKSDINELKESNIIENKQPEKEPIQNQLVQSTDTQETTSQTEDTQSNAVTSPEQPSNNKVIVDDVKKDVALTDEEESGLNDKAMGEIDGATETLKEPVQTSEPVIAPVETQQQNKETLEQTADTDIDVLKKTASTGEDKLNITVNATSWADIKDANGTRLIKDLLKQGQKYQFVGKKPFKIFLGNGFGVEISLNGKNQDFSNYIKSNNTARFELGK